jgi:hypothetical protein
MRFWLSGPRILGIRPGISFQPSDFRPRPSRPRAASYIYVIKGEENNVKIGVTKKPAERLAQLRTGSASNMFQARTNTSRPATPQA